MDHHILILKGQGKNDYTYEPGSNDDWGSDEAGTLDGIDLGSLTLRPRSAT